MLQALFASRMRAQPVRPSPSLLTGQRLELLLNQKENEQAIARYEELIRSFPTSRFADQAQFMVGYIYDLDGKHEQAGAAYQKVIDGYPGSDLVDDARVSIANLGKPPEAWFPPDSTTAGTAQAR